MKPENNPCFCTECNAISGLSIFACSLRKNKQYCPYRFDNSKSNSLIKMSIVAFLLVIILALLLIQIQPISPGLTYLFVLISLLICAIAYYQANTVVDYFYSESTGAKLQVIRWKGNALPRKYKWSVDEFFDIKVLPTNLSYPASITNIDDYCNAKKKRFLDEEACTAFANALIILAIQGFVRIIRKRNFISSKGGDFVRVSQEYFAYKCLSHKMHKINGELESLLLKNMDDSPQGAKKIDDIICGVYGTSRPYPGRWLFESILIKEVEQKGWGNIRISIWGNIGKLELDDFHKQQIKVDKETLEELSSQLQEQYPNLLPGLEKEIKHAIDFMTMEAP